jgi:hypothetical protein
LVTEQNELVKMNAQHADDMKLIETQKASIQEMLAQLNESAKMVVDAPKQAAVEEESKDKPADKEKVKKTMDDGDYDGDWENGKPHGRGTMVYKQDDKRNRVKYEGQWKNGLRHGKGKLTWKSGETYDGDWKDDKREGWGK